MACKNRTADGSGHYALYGIWMTVALAFVWIAACASGNTSVSSSCVPNATRQCQCVDSRMGAQVCSQDGVFLTCDCGPASGGGTGGNGPESPVAGSGGQGGEQAPPIDSSVQPPLDAGAPVDSGSTPPIKPVDSGAADSKTPNPPDAGSAVDTGPGNPNDPLDSARQACVDHINMYRATLGLAPLSRATPEVEACSDKGAQQDGTGGGAHSSAGSCPGMGGQNTCPNWPVGGWGGGATLEDTVKKCLDQMWAEGAPPVPVADCIRDYAGCFMTYGHYINMSMERYTVVSCGFYETSPGTWWMNQDFGY